MFKRFTCMVLSFVLLLALLPAVAVEASAASHETSDNAITILKKLETFSAHCDANGYIGYGTKCEENGRHGITVAEQHMDPVKGVCGTNGYFKDGTKCTRVGRHGCVHTIRETEADAALRKALKTIDTAINTFASNRGLSLSQQQHDALAVFSFENGTAWTKGTDDLQNAVATGKTGWAFVDVMTKWSVSDNDDRRMVEANMYLFGKYNTTASDLYTNLAKADDNTVDPDTELVNSDRVLATVTNAYINVREKANIFSAKVGTVYAGEQLRITATTENNGYLWGRYVDENYEKVGYVALMYTNYDEVVAGSKYNNTASTTPTVVAKAEVKVNGYVNVRSGAGTQNPIISSLRNGSKVDLYEIKYVNGQKWGRYDVGWFSLAYATLTDEELDFDTLNDYNYINYLFNGKLKSGTTMYSDKDVTKPVSLTADEAAKTWSIGDITVDGSNIWGKTSKGWVLMGDVDIEPATFTTITEVTVRKTPGVDGVRKDTLAKGTEFDVDLIEADNNTIWGFSDNLGTTDNKYDGWIDLSTNYVTRKGAELQTKPDASSEKCTLGTVVNCAEVNVRSKANIFGSKVATLPAGTTVEIVEGPVNGTRTSGWYLLNILPGDGVQSWVRGDYLDIRKGTRAEINYGTGTVETSPDGTQSATGRGMVANTYGGVNVRTAPGTANAQVTKLLPGTEVSILEVTYYGSTKWGRISQGWVCMDYIAMMDYDDLPGSSSSNVSSTAAIYEGKIDAGTSVDVYLEADRKSGVVRTLSDGDTINIHELLTVPNVTSDNGTTTTTKKMYWARINDGYICDIDEDRNNLNQILSLNTLYEETYTVTETDLLKVRENPGSDQAREDLDLKKGDQVKITQLAISGDQVWGRFENDDLTDGNGWICLSYCTRGAVSVGSGESSGNGGSDSGSTTTTPTTLSIGNTGKCNYMGTIIGNYSEVNVRKSPDATSEKVTELKKGASVTITETQLVDGRSWGYCGTGWINLVYVDLTPVGITAIDAKVIATNNTLCYESSEAGAKVVGSYASRAVVNIYEEINGMYKTDMGWVSKDNFL